MRTRMITRTVTFTTVKAMTVNTTSATVENKTITVIGEYPEKDLLKLVKNEIESDENYKFVSIIESYKDEQSYGMPEDEFVKLAKIITR